MRARAKDGVAALHRFRDYKRSTALLDFDDLIFAARDLLRDHDDVRRSLAARFSKVLVDEFQDTDPLQTEIFWRLCGESPVEGETADRAAFTIRPGALFLVADPKQAIHRFRGADVSAYVRARDAFIAQDGDSVLPISTNFRSCAPILTYVNERFEALLSSDGQPGSTALDPFHADRGEGRRLLCCRTPVGPRPSGCARRRRADECARPDGTHRHQYRTAMRHHHPDTLSILVVMAIVTTLMATPPFEWTRRKPGITKPAPAN